MNRRTIAELMTHAPHSVGFDRPVKVAQDMMHKYGVRHLPVEKGGKLVGVLSHRDIYLSLALDREFVETLTCEDVCTPEPYVVSGSERLKDVVERMAADKLGCAIVVETGKVVGIYTTVDACRDFATQLSKDES